MELWSELQLKIHKFFEGIKIEPSLLHGDLWSGNMAETISGPGKRSVVFITNFPWNKMSRINHVRRFMLEI